MPLNLRMNKKKFFLDFITLNEVVLKDGEYRHEKSNIQTLQIARIENEIGFDQNMESVLREEMADGELELPDFSVAPILKKIIADNTDETYNVYLKKVEGNKKLYLNIDIK